MPKTTTPHLHVGLITFFLLCFALTLLAQVASAYWAENRPPAGTAHSLPAQLFPANNWWNLDISQAPVDPKSATYIANLGGGASPLAYDWGNNYGLPYTTVSGDYPKVNFQGCSYWNESDHIPYPIPVPALTQPGWTEDLTGTIDNPVSTGDRHLLIVDTDNQYLYEIYQPFHNTTSAPIDMGGGNMLQPGNYWCASAAFWDMKTNNTRTDGWTSSDAAGLQVLPGLVQYDEVMGAGPITHAHRFTLNMSADSTPFYVWPATHFAGNYSPIHPPLGARFRLKAGKDISGFGPHAQKVLQAMKTYGILFADNGPNGQVTGTNDARWGNYDSPIRTEFSVAMNSLTFDDFEVVQLGWKPGTVALSPCDVNGDGVTVVSDVQLAVNQANGAMPCVSADINKDTLCNVLDVQRVVNAALGRACVSP